MRLPPSLICLREGNRIRGYIPGMTESRHLVSWEFSGNLVTLCSSTDTLRFCIVFNVALRRGWNSGKCEVVSKGAWSRLVFVLCNVVVPTSDSKRAWRCILQVLIIVLNQIILYCQNSSFFLSHQLNVQFSKSIFNIQRWPVEGGQDCCDGKVWSVPGFCL